MIKEEDLKNTVFSQTTPGGLFFDCNLNYAFDVKTQTFYLHDEVEGDLEELTKITDMETLQEIYEIQPLITHGLYKKI